MVRRFPVWSTLALLPATVGLLLARSGLGLVYLASMVVTLVYHASGERLVRRLDHALAYAVIAANTWMVFHARREAFAFLGIAFVLAALYWYRRACERPMEYDKAHGIWHFLCGAAGAAFVHGYLR